jgi:hypothetical protein
MAATATRMLVLDSFRSEWVSGHLDYQRAAEVLEGAERAAAEARAEASRANDDARREVVRRAESTVESARRRLTEVASILSGQFDRFCSVTR